MSLLIIGSKCKPRICSITLIVGLLQCLVGTARATLWTVNGDGTEDFTEIQAAINATAEADTVLVKPGTYLENLHLPGHDIVLISSAGPQVTIIDGSAIEAPVLQIRNGQSHATTVDGFSLTRGTGTPVQGWNGGGGGILIVNSEPTISHNIVRNNHSQLAGAGYGGGIYAVGTALSRLWKPIITNNVIEDNLSLRNGGGVGVANSMAPIILTNTVTGNVVDDGDGGGMWLWAYSPSVALEVASNSVTDNAAGDHGGGIYVGSATNIPVAVNLSLNLVDGNRASGRSLTDTSGGGIWLGYCTGHVSNNTIVRNVSAEFIQGGGLTVISSSIEINRNIIALTASGGGIVCIESQLNIHDNLAWNNIDGDGGGDCHLWTGVNGNIVADPQFCDLSGSNFTVASSSPALTHSAGPIGAFMDPGCKGTAVMQVTWSFVKNLIKR